MLHPSLFRVDVPPYRLSGTVYAALLNHRPQWAALGAAAHRSPYQAPAQAPVLAIKPRNTLAASGATVAAPGPAHALSVGATLAIVIGRSACRVTAADAISVVAGYAVVADLSVPHASHYRPAVRLKARDDSCVLGSAVAAAAAVPRPDALAVRIHVGGRLVQSTDTADRVRGVAQLIADVTDFMTLQPGDLLLLGESADAPLARAGERVTVGIDAVGSLDFDVVGEAGEGGA